MKRSSKYVALDAHQASTVASVREEAGRVMAQTILPAEEPALVDFFREMRAIHSCHERRIHAPARHLRGHGEEGIP